MGLRFRKSVQIIPGVRVNLGSKSASVTVGARRGPKVTRSTTGRTTVSTDLPGPFSWVKTFGRRRRNSG
jgi:hypothetical protein